MSWRCPTIGWVFRFIVLCVLGLAPITPPVSAGDSGALTPSERKLLRDPEAARQEILRRVQNAESALALQAQDPASRAHASALRRELDKAQRALETEDYKAAYVFARRVEGWATAGPKAEQ